MAPAVTGHGLDWVLGQTAKALRELQALAGTDSSSSTLFKEKRIRGLPDIMLGSASSLTIPDDSIDCVVMDPPYYDNVMYAELSDFFYVWLKRTAGALFPDAFARYLTDKDHEAVANPRQVQRRRRRRQEARRSRLPGADGRDLHRVPPGHQAARRDDRHVHPQGERGLGRPGHGAREGRVRHHGLLADQHRGRGQPAHQGEVGRQEHDLPRLPASRGTGIEDAETVYWEEVEPRVQEAVRERVAEFQEAGIGGVDLYLASFGPALQVFSENWPLRRGRPIQKPRELALFPDEEFDPYAVWPEDALDAARREVKRWRMEQLATVKRQHHLDPLTEWYVLAWDAFKAPRFPVDEALKLARVVGLDFDREVKNDVCEVKSSDVVLWDSLTRKRKGKLGPIGEAVHARHAPPGRRDRPRAEHRRRPGRPSKTPTCSTTPP